MPHFSTRLYLQFVATLLLLCFACLPVYSAAWAQEVENANLCDGGTDGCTMSGCPNGFECVRPPHGCQNDRQCIAVHANAMDKLNHVQVMGPEDEERCKGGVDTCSKSGCPRGWRCIRPANGCVHDTECMLISR